MKNLSKLFLAVAALFAFACTTDTTEDLGVQLGNGAGQTTLTLSLEESRTQLGTAVAGLYPVTWSEGDVISVNGVESSAISISENKSVATFTFNEVLAYPYTIAYPAAAEGKVLFADQQAHTEGTFAEGAAAMYGYKTAEGGLALNHLTGVLKIGVTGDKTLSFAQISNADRAPIAGEFALNFETGEVTPTTTSKEVISYSFGDGLALTGDAQYIHATVPAGEYDELYVTLYDTEGGVMYTTIKADDTKPLNAGKVREFSNTIAYAPNAEAFVIRDVATLKAFGEQAATLEKNALVVADIDMTGEAWTPIEGYAKTLLGNGYAIKGLTAPLFGTTNASIKGLHLEDVAIVTNDAPVMGALACTVTATDDVAPVIEHCSVSGSFTVENKNYATPAKDTKTDLIYGSLVGRSYGVSLIDCVNYASFTIKQSISTSCEFSALSFPGGIVGAIYAFDGAATDVYANLDGCINRGPILVHDTSREKGAGMTSYWMGGIVGFVGKSNVVGGYIANCKNDATMTFTEINNHAGQYAQIGGIVGVVEYLASNLYEITDCENTENGDILVTGSGNNMYIGGIAGYNYNCAHKNIVNRGDVTINAEYTNLLFVAGCLSSPGLNDTDGNHHFTAENVANYGKVTINGYGTTVYLGGVIGRGSQGDFTNVCNYGEVSLNAKSNTMTNLIMGGMEASGVGDSDAGIVANCHNYGTVTAHVESNAMKQILLAGYTGYNHQTCSNCSNAKGATLTLTGTINLTAKSLLEDTTTDSQYNIGGFSGYAASTAKTDCKNEADVVVDVTWTSAEGDATLAASDTVTAADSGAPFIQIGGFIGRSHSTLNTCEQSGKVILKGTSEGLHGAISVGGVLGSHVYNTNGDKNYGDIHITGKHGLLFVGGLHGYIHGYNTTARTHQNGENHGDIYIGYDENKAVVATELFKAPKIGGLCGWANYRYINATNNGDIKINVSAANVANTDIYLGGCVGYGQKVGSKALSNDFADLTNNGNITLEGNAGAKAWNMGGVFGYTYGKSTQMNFTNNGDILVHFTEGTGFVRVGGIAHGIRRAIDGAVNNGDITIKGMTGSSLYIGGIISTPNGYHRNNMTNNGNILVDATVGKDCFIGGICYDAANGNKTKHLNCHNTGDIEVTSKTTVKGGIAVGGLIGKYPTGGETKIFDGCSNSGNITVAAYSTGGQNIGGLMGYLSYSDNVAAIIVIQNGFVNTGNITHSGRTDGADNIHVAGLLGYCSKGSFMVDGVAWSGDVVNKGKITASGKSIGGRYRVAGMIGYSTCSLPAEARFINLGDIEFTGDAGIKNDVPGISYVSGILAESVDAGVTNAEVYCNINALEADYTGFVSASPRSETIIAKDCKIGGTIMGTVTGEDSDGNVSTTTSPIALDANNWFDYIYGGTTSWGDDSNYDGCSLLTEAPVITPATPAI